MIPLLLGGFALLALMAALGMFSKAKVADVKSFGIWFVAIGGILLAAMLFFTGRGGSAIAALLMLAPLVWSWTQKPGQASASSRRTRPQAAGRGAMSREEAYAVLGLQPGANEEAVREAHRRLMRMAHPDSGGSDWLASRINQARDVLLG